MTELEERMFFDVVEYYLFNNEWDTILKIVNSTLFDKFCDKKMVYETRNYLHEWKGINFKRYFFAAVSKCPPFSEKVETLLMEHGLTSR